MSDSTTSGLGLLAQTALEAPRLAQIHLEQKRLQTELEANLQTTPQELPGVSCKTLVVLAVLYESGSKPEFEDNVLLEMKQWWNEAAWLGQNFVQKDLK